MNTCLPEVDHLLKFRADFESELSYFEQQIWIMYLQRCSYKQIAKECQIGVRAVNNALQRARRKLRE